MACHVSVCVPRFDVLFPTQSLGVPGGNPWFPGAYAGRGRGNADKRKVFVRSIAGRELSLASSSLLGLHLRRSQSASRVERVIGTQTREVLAYFQPLHGVSKVYLLG